MAKASYTVEPDGSITFETGDVSDSVKEKAYEEAARQRAAATNIPEDEAAALVEEAHASAHREKATEVTE